MLERLVWEEFLENRRLPAPFSGQSVDPDVVVQNPETIALAVHFSQARTFASARPFDSFDRFAL